MNDCRLDECIHAAAKLIEKGATVFQKFTCAGCGERLTMETPNKFFLVGYCGCCGAVTDIQQQGCGYLVELTL